jgi:hypothetical protein
MDNEFTEERFKQLNGQVTLKGEATLRTVSEGTLPRHIRRPTDGGEQATKDINRLVGNIKLKLMRRAPLEEVTTLEGKVILPAQMRRAQPSGISLDFFDDFFDRLLGLMPLKYRERAYEPSKCDAETNRLERLEKDGNEVAANRGYRREMCKVVFIIFLALPMFLMGEILAQVRRMVAR